MGSMGARENSQKGLTLIELLIVVAIIGILSVIVLYNFALAADRARQVECASRLRTIGYALYAYRLDNNTYPLADGVAGDKPTPFETDYGNGPAGNGFWDGISLLLVECGYIEDPNILYCPALAKRYPYRRPNLRYAYNCGTADAGGYEGGDNNIFRDSHDIWLVRCLRVDPDEYKRDRRRAIPFPHGLNRTMENVLFSNGRVELVPGGMSTP